ncbi:hypothetical protein GXW82_07040 [Streptacidiphilus sp. 4-A2]|nr:hypothetical protein [Streptacidiphilus sp. 4-A2]
MTDRLAHNGISKFDLTFAFSEDPGEGGLTAGIEYATALFDAATVEAFAGRLTRLLEAVVADPRPPLRAYDLLSTDERVRLAEWGEGARLSADLPAAGLPQLFAAQVAAHPDAVAVSGDGEPLSYRELDLLSAELAAA